MATADVTPNLGTTDAAAAEPVKSSADRAMDNWNASAPDAQPPKPGTTDAIPAVDPNAAAQPDPNAQPNPNASLEALKDDPRVIELLAAEEQFKAFQEVLEGLPYAVTNPEEAKQQFSDAGMLYDIVSGKRPASDLLKVMTENNHWTPEQKQAVFGDLAKFIGEQTGQPVVAAAAGKPQFTDPVMQKLAAIEERQKAEDAARDNAKQQAEQARVNTAFEGQIAELCKDFPDDAKFYGSRVAAKIAGNTAIIAQVAKGNFAQVRKLFTEERNADVERFKRWSDGLLTKKLDDKNKLPTQPNGGVVPQGTQPLKFKTQKEAEDYRLKILQGQA